VRIVVVCLHSERSAYIEATGGSEITRANQIRPVFAGSILPDAAGPMSVNAAAVGVLDPFIALLCTMVCGWTCGMDHVEGLVSSWLCRLHSGVFYLEESVVVDRMQYQ
jgi:hypothetical protein